MCTLTRHLLPTGLLLTLLLALLGCGAAPAPSAPTPDPSEVTFRKLVPEVWLHISYKTVPPWGRVPTTGLVVVHGDHSVMVDTAWDDPQTEAVVRWARETLGKPVTAAVLTHAHADKMGGTAALKALDVATWAAADSNALAPSKGLVPAEHSLTFDPRDESRQIPPLVVFDPGGGHTHDNIVVGLPQHGVIFGGCMIRPPGTTNLGNTADADMAHWDQAVEATAARFPDAVHVVPSHGPPAGRELLEATVRLVHKARQAAAEAQP